MTEKHPWWRPSRTIPPTSWQAPSRWRARPATVIVLITGLWLFGTGEALLVEANLGVTPWTVLAQGITEHIPISIGMATFLTSVVVLLLWIPLREKPGLGTIANAIVIATALQVMSTVIPSQTTLVVQIPMVVLGIVITGIGSAMYLTTHLGPGPRDGWMTGIHLRTGWPVTYVRWGIELTVLSIGWLLGGVVGVGTVLFALLIGPSVGYSLMLAGRLSGPAPQLPIREDDAAAPELDA